MRLLTTILMLCACAALNAADRIKITLTVTNTPTEGLELVVNTDTRTWTNTVGTPASDILIGSDEGDSATNLYQHIAATPFSGPMVLGFSSSNVVTLLGTLGQAMSATATDWATVTYSTQTVTSLTVVRVPMSGVTEYERTNHATLLTAGLEDYAQAAVDNTSTFASSLVGTDNAQAITGAKTLLSVTTSNLVNVGDAISSTGSGGTYSLQLGSGADASAARSTAIGYTAASSDTNAISLGYAATASGVGSMALGTSAIASGTNSVALGQDASATGVDSIALGVSSGVLGDNAMALGKSADADYDGSVSIGYGVATTAAGEIRIGVTTNDVVIPGELTVSTSITNTTYHGTVGNVTSGYWSSGTASSLSSTNTTLRGTNVLHGIYRLPRTDYTSLANGDNSGIDFGEATYIKLDAGPSAVFTIAGIAGGADGRLLIIDNRLAYNMTIGHEDGAETTAANRIVSPTGADLTSTTYAVVMLLYDSEDQRWHVINWED